MKIPTDQDIDNFFLSIYRNIIAGAKALWARMTADWSYLWANDKIFLTIFGVLIVAAKGTSLLMDLYAYLAKRTITDASKEDATLASKENADNAAANKLISDADNLPKQEGTVSPDWYTKK